MHYLLYFIVVAWVLSGCASKPVFDTSDVDRSITPTGVVSDIELSIDRRVLWGGTILQTKNLKDFTQIEILSYPLDTSYRPETQKRPEGRFIVRYSGYLEPENYAQGRMLTVLGQLASKIDGKVGDSEYTYPLVQAQQLQLWSTHERRTNFHFGIGINLSN